MKQDSFVITTMTREELDIGVEWAAREGWNPGIHDADCFYAADPEGFLLGRLDGEPVGCISVVKYGTSFAFLGLYIVAPAFRHQGYGLRLWQAGMKSLAGRTVGLDGVVEQQRNYARSGFALAYRNIRHEGRGGCPAPDRRCVVDLASLPFGEIEAYDRSFFPEPRTAFLQRWVAQADRHAVGYIEDGALAGYAVLRPCRTGYKFGPLFADTEAMAEVLFTELASRVGESDPIFLDTPEANPAAVALAKRQGMTPCFETARMYAGPAPELSVDRTYGVTTFELG